MVQEAATEVRRFLAEHGIASFIKTTGNRGLHVYVRVEPGWDSFGTRQAAIAVARALAAARPICSPTSGGRRSAGARVFLDFNQNAPHKTVFGAWCVRARPGAQVSTPFAWDELDSIHPDALTVRSVPDRLANGGDPWADIDAAPQSIAALVEATNATSPAGSPTRRGRRCTRRCPTRRAG